MEHAPLLNPICPRCGLMYREYARLHRRELGVGWLHGTCECCCDCSAFNCSGGEQIELTLSNIVPCNVCNSVSEKYTATTANGTYILTRSSGTAGGCTFTLSDTIDGFITGNFCNATTFNADDVNMDVVIDFTNEEIDSVSVTCSDSTGPPFTGSIQVFRNISGPFVLCGDDIVNDAGGPCTTGGIGSVVGNASIRCIN